jgi:CRP-like cAMP-binding protein
MREFNPVGGARTGVGLAADAASAMGEGAASPLANGLLRAIGPDAASALIAAGRPTRLKSGQTLWQPGQPGDSICFPLTGLIVGLATDLDGLAAQVECTGPDSAVGLVEALAGVNLAFEHRAMVETEAWLAPAEVVRDLVRACPATAQVFHRHIARLYDAARRASACAARHALRARLANCLLAYHEKTALARLPVTQETLSALLGANRTTVTALAIGLSEAGLTRTGRGWISIVDAQRLDRLACGCRHAASRNEAEGAPA